MTVEELREALRGYDDGLEIMLQVDYEEPCSDGCCYVDATAVSTLKGVFEVGGVVHLDGGFRG